MRAKSRRLISRIYRAFFGILTAAGYSVIFVTFMSFTTTLRVSELAPVLLPVLAGFFAFSALLYNRARAYPDGRIQRRSLYVADEAMEATLLYLLALLIGGIMTWFVLNSEIEGVDANLSFENLSNFTLFLIYVIPLFLIGLSFVAFSNALRIFCRGFSPFSGVRKKLTRMKKLK